MNSYDFFRICKTLHGVFPDRICYCKNQTHINSDDNGNMDGPMTDSGSMILVIPSHFEHNKSTIDDQLASRKSTVTMMTETTSS